MPNNANYFCLRALELETAEDLIAIFAITYRKKDGDIRHLCIYRDAFFRLCIIDDMDNVETFLNITTILHRLFEDEAFTGTTIPLSHHVFASLKQELVKINKVRPTDRFHRLANKNKF